MCLRVFIASKHVLPLIGWNPHEPTLFIRALDDVTSKERLRVLFPDASLYEAGSFMGCGCGFTYGVWSVDDPHENHEERKRDVFLLKDYLRTELTKGPLDLFCTWWGQIKEHHETIEFDLDRIDDKEFDFPEDIILKLRLSQT